MAVDDVGNRKNLPRYSYEDKAIDRIAEFDIRGTKFRVCCAGESDYHPSYWSFCDEVETRELWWNIQPGDVVLDVGADFGSYSLSALALGASHVHAWSPPFKVPDRAFEATTLRSSAVENGWETQISVYSGGLWRGSGYLAAFDGPRPAIFCTTEAKARAMIEGQPGHCSYFPVSTLDTRGLSLVNWIKIDTEGCELPILQGGESTIRRCRPKIILEHHYHLDPSCEVKCDVFLADLGYTKQGTRRHATGIVSHSLYLP